MLVLTQKIGDMVRVGDNIQVRILSRVGNKIQVGYTAPADVVILRDGLEKRKKRTEKEPANV